MAATEFTVGEKRFFLEPLKVKKQLRAASLIAPIFLDLARSSQPASVDTKLASLDGLPELVDLFAARCKVEHGSPQPIDLAPLLDNVFERKPSMLFAWLVECVHIELGDFLGENGQNLFKGMVMRFGSPKASTGGSTA